MDPEQAWLMMFCIRNVYPRTGLHACRCHSFEKQKEEKQPSYLETELLTQPSTMSTVRSVDSKIKDLKFTRVPMVISGVPFKCVLRKYVGQKVSPHG